MTAAKTVSRASPAFSAGAATMTETISATSITVTATAKTSVPYGSPVRCATTSAWYTAANTVAISSPPDAAALSLPTPTKGVINRSTHANTGHTHAHQGIRANVMPMYESLPRPTNRWRKNRRRDGFGKTCFIDSTW